jgi:hypothetical protein
MEPGAGRVAIVGAGLAGFVVYVTLRHAGLRPDEITVFGPTSDPVAAWRPRALAIRQRFMRSESDGHCLPTSFPGLAVREAARRRSLVPVVRSVCDRYHPTLNDFLAHVSELRDRSGWDESMRAARIEHVVAVDGGFAVDGGTFRHVLLAPGHPGLAVPPELADDPRTVHAYEPHEYADQVAVIGAGMAAATEWLNALAAGASVVSVRRREPERRPLNVPRPLFTRRGLAAFHAAAPERRATLLREWSAPSYPPGRAWDAPLQRAATEGRFRVAAELNGADQVICATGFRRGFRESPLLSRLVDDHDLPTYGSWIALDRDATVPALTDRSKTLALAGIPAQWAFPAADTLVGMKYSAHGFARRVSACRTP